MYILYILECMLRGLAPTDKPLITTNEAITWNDILVCWCGWVAIVLIVIFVVCIKKYIIKKIKKEKMIKKETRMGEHKVVCLL